MVGGCGKRQCAQHRVVYAAYGAFLAGIKASRAAVFNLKERRLQVGGGELGEILKLKLYGLPLGWVRPFVHAADVSGGMITGELVQLIPDLIDALGGELDVTLPPGAAAVAKVATEVTARAFTPVV